MSANDSVEEIWRRLCSAEDAFYEARMALHASGADLGPLIDAALSNPSRRGTALRLLEIQPEAASRRHLGALVSLASVGDRDIGLARSVLARIDKDWVSAHIEAHVVPILHAGGEEEYRRIAEIHQQLGSGLLAKHLGRCLRHSDADVREIADDFGVDSPKS